MAALAALLVFLGAPAFASADVLVNTTADGDDGSCSDGDCTLREAIAVSADGETIVVPPGTYSVSIDHLVVGNDVIAGSGARSTTITANNTSRVFYIDDGAVARISGVTVTGGDGTGSAGNSAGGGIFVDGDLTLAASTVSGNTTGLSGGGINVAADSFLTVTNSTISGNLASAGLLGAGGGIAVNIRAQATVTNTTISGNRAEDAGPSSDQGQGGAIWSSGLSELALTNVTLAGNTTDRVSGGTGGLRLDEVTTLTLDNVIAVNGGQECEISGGTPPTISSHGNVFADSTCNLAGPNDRQGVDPLLGLLANNGGPTDTHAITLASPAIDIGTGCPATDQRGFARGTVCDSGAYELQGAAQPASLTVATTVVNDQGGTAEAGNFVVHVRSNGADVSGSPGQSTYTLTPGSYSVSADTLRGYTFTYGGACNSDGTVAVSGAATCTVTANDPAPTLNKVVNGTPESGTVKVKLPGRNAFRILREGEQLPNGTVVDTLKGRITLTTAAPNGKVSKADFYDGIFKFKQAKGLTTLTLVEKLSCKSTKAPRHGQGQEEAPPVGRRQGPLPDQGQAQRGNGGRHEVAGGGHLHDDTDARGPRNRQGAGLREEEDDDPQAGQALHREGEMTRPTVQGPLTGSLPLKDHR